SDRDTLSRDGRGDVEVFDWQAGTEPACKCDVVEATRPIPQLPPILTPQQRDIRTNARIVDALRGFQQRRRAKRREDTREQLDRSQSRPTSMAIADRRVEPAF